MSGGDSAEAVDDATLVPSADELLSCCWLADVVVQVLVAVAVVLFVEIVVDEEDSIKMADELDGTEEVDC